MTINHHPDEDLLLSYASGELAEAWSLLVATHIALCPACRSIVRKAEAVGGAIVADTKPAAMSADAFESTMARIERSAGTQQHTAVSEATNHTDARPVLPQPLRGYVGGDVETVSWRRLGNAFHLPLIADKTAPTARLLRIPAGQPVPEHGHKGNELTLVLKGSFVDQGVRYASGDVEAADPSVDHQPVAEPGEDCICLAVTDAPLRLRGALARIAQPFIGI